MTENAPTEADDTVTISPKDLLGAAEVTEQLGISKTTLDRLAKYGQLRPFRIMPGRTGARLYLRRDVDAYAEQYAALVEATANDPHDDEE